MQDGAFTFQSNGRRSSTLIVVVAVWGVLGLAIVIFDAAFWIVAVLGAFTLPAFYDLVRNTKAGMTLDAERVTWFSGRRSAELALDQIRMARLDTRLDLSVRACFVLNTGRKVRVPFEATPPHEQLEAALSARGIKVERHHFSLTG